METLRTLLFMLFYYLMFVPLAILVRALRFKKNDREARLVEAPKTFGPQDFEDIF